MSNVDSKTKAFFDRMVRLETEKRELAESIRDLAKEMKGVGIQPDELAGIKLAVKRHFETEEARAKRETAESVADALGDFKDSPLGAAAVRAAVDSGLPNAKAMKIIKKMKERGIETTVSFSPDVPNSDDLAVGG